MQILIESNGTWEGTRIWVNGQLQAQLVEMEFAISVRNHKQGKPALNLMEGDGQGKVVRFTRYFGNDFEKYDELFPDERARGGQDVGSGQGTRHAAG